MLCHDLQMRFATIGLMAIAAVLAASGCSSAPTAREGGRPVAKWRISQPDLLVPSPERTAVVSFLRDKGTIDAKCTHNILVNGRVAFAIRNGESQTIYLAPGQYSIGMQSSGSGCPNVGISEYTNLGPGAHETYRIFSPNSYGARLIKIK